MNAWILCALGINAAVVMMAAAWAVARKFNNAGVIEPASVYGLAAIAGLYAAAGGGDPIRRGVVAAIAVFWSVSLGTRLMRDLLRRHPNEPARYASLRQQFPKRTWYMFFACYQARAVLIGMISSPLAVACANREAVFTGWDAAGLAVGLAGLGMVPFLKPAKEPGASSGRRLAALASITWSGLFLIALGSPMGWATIWSPLLLFLLLTSVLRQAPCPAAAGTEPSVRPVGVLWSVGILLAAAASLSAAPSPGDLIARGDALDARYENRAALALYLQADALSPNDAEILHRISKQFAQLLLDAPTRKEKKELGAKALEAARRAVECDPRNSQAHLAVAISCGRVAFLESPGKRIQMSKTIRDEAELAARLDARNDLAWHVLGRWNYEVANFNPLLKGLARAFYGKLPDASNETAIACFQRALVIAPQSAIHHVELGRAYAAAGQTEKARRHLEQGLVLPAQDKDAQETRQRARVALEALR